MSQIIDGLSAVTEKGTVWKVRLTRGGAATTLKFWNITAYVKDNPDLPLPYMRLGEIHDDAVNRLIASGGQIRL